MARLAARYTSSRRETPSDPGAPSETGSAVSGSIPAHGMKVTPDFLLISGLTGSSSLYLAQIRREGEQLSPRKALDLGSSAIISLYKRG